MILGKVRIKGKVVLAPLAGVTDSSFRWICRQLGAAAVFTEMISADGLVRDSQKTREYMAFREAERPIGFQLFGSDPEVMARAAKIAGEMQPDFIDLNFGCPVKKVVKRGAGAALLNDVKLAGKIASAVVKVSPVPVTAKIRKGWNKESENALEVARKLEQAGVAAITVHGRTQSEMFRGAADWEIIAEIKREISIPVIGNGDVRSAEEAKKMLDKTGCDLVMIGRGAMGNPWIFQQVNHYLETGELLPPPTPEQRLAIILQHLDDRVQGEQSKRALFEMRKHLSWYVKGLPGCAQIRAQLFQLDELSEVKNKLTEYLTKVGVS
ncbi:tRNA dihydrouridine synthase DusB [candidate division KSB1 bacterium 4484_87]|nr:MAG: tRNA dihydrouridine synthase DusB [candidate division KSB1 bacterium 4484_87]